MPTPLLHHPALAAAALLTGSNLFMTFAWYGHLKNMQNRAWRPRWRAGASCCSSTHGTRN
jgi:hypothetical protein